ncbi:hypothetical protein QO200_03865 [Flavobacterium sp. Arc3]|uniref:hypothetical protein n=1 Tax=Flavobacterium sp. Arc3 TaxID=3046686 RepID=UPI00352BE36F
MKNRNQYYSYGNIDYYLFADCHCPFIKGQDHHKKGGFNTRAAAIRKSQST